MNALHYAMCAGNLKVPISFNGNASNICTHPFPSGDDCPNHVPVWNPKTLLGPFGRLLGNPHPSTLQSWRHCRPLAVISRGITCCNWTCSGVDGPTHTASSQ